MMDNRMGLQPNSTVVRAEALGHWDLAEEALARAREQAAQVLADAQTQREAQMRIGFETGMRMAAEKMTSIVAQTAAGADRQLREIEAVLPGLVIEVVRQILGELDANEVMRRCIEQALTKIRRASSATLRVCPQQIELARETLAQAGTAADGIFIEADSRLPVGQCVISSAYGVAELGAAEQLRIFADQLGNAFRANAG
jgi:type III secretion protein L